MHVTILGRRYGFRFVPFLGKNVHGKCEKPSCPNPMIRIKKGLSEEQTLDAILHEIGHASDWNKTEEWITDFATDAAKILIRLGYRRIQEGKLDGK